MAFIGVYVASAAPPMPAPAATARRTPIALPAKRQSPRRKYGRPSLRIIHDFNNLDASFVDRTVSSQQILLNASLILTTGRQQLQYGYGPVSASRLLYIVRRLVASPHWDTVPAFALDRFLCDWYESADQIGGLSVFEARALSNIIFALAGIRRTPAPAFLHDWQSAASARILQFNAQELSLCLQAFAQFDDPNAILTHSFVEVWMDAAHRRLPEFTDQALINSFHALVKLHYSPSPGLLADWVDLVLVRVPCLEPVGLCNLLHTLSKLTEQIPRLDHLLDLWSQAAIPVLHQSNDQSLSVVIYSLGHLKDRTGSAPSDEFIQAWYKAVKARLSTLSLSCQGLSNTIYALGKLRVEPDSEFLQLWDRAARWKITEFTPQHFSNMIVGFSLLGLQPSCRFMLVWYAYAEPDRFTPQGLANSLAALTRLGCVEPPEEFLSKWSAATYAALPKFSAQELCSTLHSITHMQWHCLPNQLLARWGDQAARVMPELSCRELSMTMHLFGRLSVVPSNVFLNAWQPAVLAREHEFSPSQSLSIIVALAKLTLHSMTETEAFRGFLRRALGGSNVSLLSQPDMQRGRAALIELRIAD